MGVKDFRRTMTEESLGSVLLSKFPEGPPHVHMEPTTTTRTDTYKGHKIEIKTTYELKVDGKTLHGHIGVGNNGSVHYHGLPNYNWGSTVDLVREVIDSFPKEFQRGKRKSRPGKRSRKYATKKRR